MGQEETKKEVAVQISDKKKKDYLIGIIESYLKTAKSLMEYYHAIASTRKAKLICNKSIKSIETAINHLRQIKHIKVLEYIYSTFIGNNVIAYSISGQVVMSKKMLEYDTDEGIKELEELIEENRKKAIEKEKQRKENAEAIARAKEQGKKVEMVWDKDTKTAKPMIIEEKDNA